MNRMKQLDYKAKNCALFVHRSIHESLATLQVPRLHAISPLKGRALWLPPKIAIYAWWYLQEATGKTAIFLSSPALRRHLQEPQGPQAAGNRWHYPSYTCPCLG